MSCGQPGNSVSPLDAAQDFDHKPYLQWSYAQLNSASDSLASYLSKEGACKGEAMVVVTQSCAEWATCFWAAAKMGCPFVPINPAIAGRANEVQHILSALETLGVLVAGDESIMSSLQQNAPTSVQKTGIRLILGSAGFTGWTAFEDALNTPELSSPPVVDHRMEETVLIVLTSGTTDLPKGCPHTNSTVASMCARHKIMYSLDENRVSCNHMPLFHLAGIMESLWAWAHGGTVVFPSKSFDARATLDAIDNEQCTDMCLVPSMLRAISDHPALSIRTLDSMQLIKLAAADVLGKDARDCSEILHADVVTNIFGMTETSGISQIFAWQDGSFKDSAPFPVGRMAPGAKARICDPNSRVLLERRAIGELHLGGRTITDRYIGGSNDASSFYTDEAGLWHVTGDCAVMAETGEITVLGRHKDIINRAGENISPSTMEKVLNAVEHVQIAQVVGVPDEVAGEVPVAVIKTTENGVVSKNLLHYRIIQELGVAFALERVIDLKELGMDEFPTTATGKVRKADVRALVSEYLRIERDQGRKSRWQPTEALLTRIWARFCGVPETSLTPTMSLEGMVDSVTVMRFRSELKKELGRTLSIEELNKNPTIVGQATLLDLQQDTARPSEPLIIPTWLRKGPPQLSDVVHSRGNPAVFEGIRQEVEKPLHALSQSWEDVEEVLPMYDFLQFWNATTAAIHFRIVFACRQTSTTKLRSALETVLSNHGMLRTVLAKGPAGLCWAMVRSSKHWADMMISDGGTLNETQDLLTTNLRYRYSMPKAPKAMPNGVDSRDATGSPGPKQIPKDRFPGDDLMKANQDSAQSATDDSLEAKPIPLFYVTIYHIEATQSAGFVVYSNHSTFDAHSILTFFMEDLGKALRDPMAPLSPRPSYNLFANTYYNHRTSVPAQLNLEYHAARLSGISERQSGLWPRESFLSSKAPPRAQQTTSSL